MQGQQAQRLLASDLASVQWTYASPAPAASSDLHARLVSSSAAAAALRATLSQPALETGAAHVAAWSQPAADRQPSGPSQVLSDRGTEA